MSVNALRIRRVEDEDKGTPNEKKRTEIRFVTSGGTHNFESIYRITTGKHFLLFKNKSQVISKSIV